MSLLKRIKPCYLTALEGAREDFPNSVRSIFETLSEKTSPLDLTMSEFNLIILHSSFDGGLNAESLFEIFPQTSLKL